MRNFIFLSFLFIPFMSNAQTVVINNPYTGRLDTIEVPQPKMKNTGFPKMVVIGDDSDHTVFIDEELLRELEAKREDE
jgi:hypothetical protein